jgi:S-formylglutathione hydrolase FrmB
MGVAGLSMGGYCALALSLRHPSDFTVFGDYSGLASPTLDPPETALQVLFGGDEKLMASYDPSQILRTGRFEGLAGWFEVGTDDAQPLAATRSVAAEATSAGVDTCVLIRPGAHDFEFWKTSFEHSLPWMSAKLGLVPLPVDTHGATCSS